MLFKNQLKAKKNFALVTRCFSDLIKSDENRKFSVITRSRYDYKPTPFNYQVTDQEFEEKNFVRNQTTNTANLKLNDDFCFRKDKIFLKFLTWINLESSDQESISISRLVAYNIFSQLKNQRKGNDIISGVVKGLHVILNYLSQNSKPIVGDKALLQKSYHAFSKGIIDIVNLVTYLNKGPSPKNLIFTKEISGRIHEGTSKVHHSLVLEAGHACHSLINDELNYRVELINPTIVLVEELGSNDVENVLDSLKEKNKDLLFISKSVDNEVAKFVANLSEDSKASYSVMDLSEGDFDSNVIYDSLVTQLKSTEEHLGEKYVFKTAQRVLMKGNETYLLDPFFENFIGSKGPLRFEESVEVHLRSPNEAWIHSFMNEISDAYNNVSESLKNGILPESKTSFYLANQELKSYYSENPNVQLGMKIVQNAIDSAILENSEDVSSIESSFDDHLEQSIVHGTFIPATKPTKIIGDIVTICNFLFQNK